MYGQKQILQCLAVALILAVFNFHRTAIKRNREAKPRLRPKPESSMQIKENALETSVKQNQKGYCVRYPFGGNVSGSHEPNSMYRHICLDNFETWLQKQCQANCCIKNSPDELMPQKTRNGIDNGASLQNKQCHTVKTIIEPITEKLMSNRLTRDFECEIQKSDQFICSNTTTETVDFVKLEINKTKNIMDYHDFLFGMEPPPNSKPVRQSMAMHHSIPMIFFLMISLMVALLTIRYMFKLFMVDHTETFVQIAEMRRVLQVRLDEINEEIGENNNDADTNDSSNNNTEISNDENASADQEESSELLNAGESDKFK